MSMPIANVGWLVSARRSDAESAACYLREHYELDREPLNRTNGPDYAHRADPRMLEPLGPPLGL